MFFKFEWRRTLSESHRNSMSWLFGLGIWMSWFSSPGISISWLLVLWKNALESRCPDLFVSASRCRGALIPESRWRVFLVLESWCRVFWSWNFDVVVYVPPRPNFRYHRENKKITHNYVNYVVEKYFNCPNLCNIYLHNDA